jgi:hypothetical protein
VLGIASTYEQKAVAWQLFMRVNNVTEARASRPPALRRVDERALAPVPPVRACVPSCSPTSSMATSPPRRCAIR